MRSTPATARAAAICLALDFIFRCRTTVARELRVVLNAVGTRDGRRPTGTCVASACGPAVIATHVPTCGRARPWPKWDKDACRSGRVLGLGLCILTLKAIHRRACGTRLAGRSSAPGHGTRRHRRWRCPRIGSLRAARSDVSRCRRRALNRRAREQPPDARPPGAAHSSPDPFHCTTLCGVDGHRFVSSQKRMTGSSRSCS